MNAKTYRVIYSTQAELDLRDIWRYIAQFDTATANRFYDAIKFRSSALRHFPNRGRLRNDVQEGVRMIVVGKYLVFYTVQVDTVRVLRVLHGSRNLAGAFK
jgi:toxin ParE1/3/4